MAQPETLDDTDYVHSLPSGRLEVIQHDSEGRPICFIPVCFNDVPDYLRWMREVYFPWQVRNANRLCPSDPEGMIEGCGKFIEAIRRTETLVSEGKIKP